MGHAMEYLLDAGHSLSIWNIGEMVKGSYTTLEEAVVEAQVVIFCLPVNPHHEIVNRIAPFLSDGSICLSIAKGLDESGRTAAQIFAEIFGRMFASKHHYGVIYGPMISEEIRVGRYAFADIVLSEAADFQVIHDLFKDSTLIYQQAADMHGSSWSVILKNVYAILFGVADELKLGNNVRGHLIVASIAELSSIVQSFGGLAHTPNSYAGLGDLLTTATSEDSHHHELGKKLARGEWSDISGEGVHTLQMVEKYQLFDWRSYPLFSLSHDIVIAPETLNGRVEDYLISLQKAESCAI